MWTGRGPKRPWALSRPLPGASRVVGAALLGGFAACSDPDPYAWCPADEGIEVVRSEGPGAWEARGLEPRLEVLWRRGGLAEGQELAYPASLAASRAGRFAIADFQLAEAIVIEPAGEWLGAWGQRGQGPGELSTPVAVNWDTAGVLAVFDIVAPKTLFLRDGQPARPDVRIDPSFTAPVISSGQLLWAGVQPDGGVLLQPTPEPAHDAGDGWRTASILRLAPGGSQPDTVVRVNVRTMEEGDYAGWTLPGWPRLSAAVATDGSIAAGDGNGYLVTIYEPTGTPFRQLCRAAEPLPLGGRERGDGSDAPATLLTAMRNAPPPDTLAAYGRLFRGADGTLWVQRDRPSSFDPSDALHGVAGALHDVFTARGEYLGEVRAPTGARLQAAVGDTLWALEFGEMDEPSVVAYRLRYIPR